MKPPDVESGGFGNAEHKSGWTDGSSIAAVALHPPNLKGDALSIAAMQWAKRQRTGNAARKAVLMSVADYATLLEDNPDPQGRHVAWPGVARIAVETELSERTVRQHLADLEAAGFLRQLVRAGKGGGRLANWIVVAINDDGPCPFEPGQPADAAGGQPADAAGGNRQMPQGQPADERSSTYIRTTSRTTSTTDAPPDGVAEGQNAATILGEFFDWLVERSVKIPRQHMPRFGKEIKGCLDAGIAADDVKLGLALLYERGKTSNPSLVPAFVTEVQQRRSGHRPMKRESEYQTAGDRRDDEVTRAKREEAWLIERGMTVNYENRFRARQAMAAPQQHAIEGVVA